MFFWLRELAGWGLLGASLVVLRIALGMAMNTREPRIVEAAVVVVAVVLALMAAAPVIATQTAAFIDELPGYIAKVHPLDLWLLGYLLNHPEASFDEIVKASEFERQEVYSWLFKSRHQSARDSRIRTMLEIEAFLDIHQRWQAVGYPFDHLVPSLATAIGSSGDRPAALSELVGIIQNDGVRLPTLRIDSLHFAADTPYETRLLNDPDKGKRVMPVEVASAVVIAVWWSAYSPPRLAQKWPES